MQLTEWIGLTGQLENVEAITYLVGRELDNRITARQ